MRQMAQSTRSLSSEESAEDEYLYAQLSPRSPEEIDKSGLCRISMKKFQELFSSLHMPVSSFNRINAQRQFLKNILGTLLNSELQLSSSQNYQGEVISTNMSYPDKLPMLEVVLLDVQKREDPDAAIPLNSYRFNLNDKWEITRVSVRQQAYSETDVDILDTQNKKPPTLRIIAAELSTEDAYEGPEFNDEYIETLLNDIQFIKLDDHINAAFHYFNFDRNKLRHTLTAVESDLKKLHAKSKDQNLPKELTDEISMLDTLLTSQQRLCYECAKDMGNAQAAFQEECAYNKSLIAPLHNMLQDMQEALNKQISKDIIAARPEDNFELTNTHELLGYVSIASDALEESINASTKSHHELREKIAKKLAQLSTEYPEKFDKISEKNTKAMLIEIQRRLAKQPENTKRNYHLRDLSQLQDELQKLEDRNKAALEQQQKNLAWVPQIKLNPNNIQERDFVNELQNAITNLDQFFQFYSQLSTQISQSRSYISDNTINFILSTCNFVLRNPHVSDAIKMKLVENLKYNVLEGCLTRDQKTGDFIFLSNKRRQDVEATYRDNLPNVDVVMHGLEHVRSKIISIAAQLDFALDNNPNHPEYAALAALENDFKPSSNLRNVVKQYNTEREQLRTTSRSIASRIADIKKSPALRGRLLPTLLTLENNLTEVSLMETQDPIEKNIADLTAYKMLEESHRADTEITQKLANQFGFIIDIIQKSLLKMQKESTKKELDFDYALAKFNQISRMPNMHDKISTFNDIIQHDYKLISDDTISFRLREWFKLLLERHPIAGLSVDNNHKKLVYRPEKNIALAIQNIQKMQEINNNLANELKTISKNQSTLTTSWQAKQESVDNAMTEARKELSQITDMRERFAASIKHFSQQKSQFELNFIRDLALYQETLTETESNQAHQKIFADIKAIEALITEMQGLQQSFDGETAMSVIYETAEKIEGLHEKAAALLNSATQYQESLFKPEVLQEQNEKMALRKWLFLQIRMLVVDGIPDYWNGKGTDHIKLGNQQYQIPIAINDMAEKILMLEKKQSAQSLAISEHDIKWLLDTDFKKSKIPEPLQKIYAMFHSIKKANLQDTQQLETMNAELSSVIEVSLQISASSASLIKLFQKIQHVIMEELPFWDTQNGKNKFQLNEKDYEHLPHRVMQIAESFRKMNHDASPQDKITTLLGKDTGRKGFFAKKPSYDILNKRSASTNALYKAMTMLHGTDLSKEANVKMLITQFDNLQNTVNETKKSLAVDNPSALSNKPNRGND
jgi:hypothetical protein